MAITRRKALITGASGGMGKACARLLGTTQDLVLTDASPKLAQFAEELQAEGYTVTGVHQGDLGSAALLSAIMADMQQGDLPLTLIHTAGLSPSLAKAEPIMQVNLVATVRLLDAIEPLLRSGSAAVMIASTAGHLMPQIPEAATLMADPLAPDFMANIMALMNGMAQGDAEKLAGISYSLSKQAVLALTQRRAIAWGLLGARISSISPGMILTPMGQKEVQTPGGAAMQNAAPLGRPGVASDIALAAQFLVSAEASFISGCDLLVDGGSMAAFRQGAAKIA